MNDLFNPEQRRSVAIVLKSFEESLRQANVWLQGAEVNGILYQRKLNMPTALKQAAQKRITIALEQIATLAREIGLGQEQDDPAGLIRGEMSENWANLIDTQSDRLKRFGDTDPRLAETFDPAINHLAQLALELAVLFENHLSTSVSSNAENLIEI